jgi:hypothetical protein
MNEIDFTGLDKNIKKWIKSRTYNSEKLKNQQIKDWLTDKLRSFIGEGKTFREFRSLIDEKLLSAGITDYTSKDVENVFDTEQAIASAYGRYVSAMELGPQCPIWEFFYVDDGRHEEGTMCCEVAKRGGFYAAWDDPIWDFWYPPCHLGCRSSVNALPPELIEIYKINLTPQDFLKD